MKYYRSIMTMVVGNGNEALVLEVGAAAIVSMVVEVDATGVVGIR